MSRSLKKIALVVSLGTLISKIGGLARQLVIASVFGVGAAYDAYNYAYVIPGFFLILLGGINGPFHNAIVSVLSRKTREDSNHVITSLNTLVFYTLALVTLILFIASDPLITLVGPGLSQEVHKIAVIQLKIMAPIALFAGLIGIGFGSLNSINQFLTPSISPIISSIVIITFIWILSLQDGVNIEPSQLNIKGGVVLAVATSTGALLQWLVQIPALLRQGLFNIKLTCDLKHPAVQEVLKILAPATLSSGMLQINVFTDLFFASAIRGAGAGLSYANFLVQAPLGILSNTLLIPLLPTFSRLTSPNDRSELIGRIRQGLIFCSASMISIGAIFISLGTPIVQLSYARGAFADEAIKLVSAILVAYGFGMPAYLCRDLLVRVFYALGDARTPFRLSTLGIGLNILFDWCLVGAPTPWGNQIPFNFGAPGLVFSTTAINFLTCIALLLKLNVRLQGLPLKEWVVDIAKLIICGMTSGLVAWSMNSIINWPSSFLGLLTEITICLSSSLLIFFIQANSLGIKEVSELTSLLKEKISLS